MSAPNIAAMSSTTRKAIVTQEHLEEARRLREIWDRTPDRGTQESFGARYGIGSQSAVGFFLNGKTPLSLKAAKGFARGLGVPISDFSPRLAKEINDVAQVVLTTPRHHYVSDRSTLPYAPAREEAAITIPVLAGSGSMGPGADVLGHEDVVVGHLTLSPSWVTKQIKPLSAQENLRFIHGYGDSMEPTFYDGDVLLVDAGVRECKVDGIYVLSANERLYIKRVRQRMDGSYEISSDNATVKTVDVLDGNNPVEVLGRVVWAWNGKKL